MLLIVGLGNPGKEHAKSRHNMGFDCIDILAQKLRVNVDKSACKALLGSAFYGGEKILLAKPQTYMNLSGESVRALCDFYKIDITSRLLVIYDDCDLEPGRIRIRIKGSAGSHNGMKSVVTHLGSTEFPRIRIGIGQRPEHMDMVNYVLGRFSKEERETVDAAISRAADAVLDMAEHGLDHAMNRYNG